MAKKDKILDILALARLPEDAKIAHLAHRWIGKAFPKAQASAVVDCYFDANGRKPELVRKLMDEKNRQDRIKNDRTAVAAAQHAALQPPMLRYKGSYGATEKRKRTMEIAQRTFGQHIRENFNADTLALMSLITGEDRWYRVKWLEASFKPVRCALIEVVTVGAKQGHIHTRFLLYQTNRRVLVARTTARSLIQAWGGQLPESFMLEAGTLKGNGWAFRMDYEGQEMVVTKGNEEQRVEWTGRTVDE